MILKKINAEARRTKGAWLAPLSNAHRMLDDIPAAAATMEAPADLDPSNGDRAEELICLYRVIGTR